MAGMRSCSVLICSFGSHVTMVHRAHPLIRLRVLPVLPQARERERPPVGHCDRVRLLFLARRLPQMAVIEALPVKSSGAREVVTKFFVTVWNTHADALAAAVKQGTQVFVGGPIRRRGFEARDGSECESWEVIANKVLGLAGSVSTSRVDSAQRSSDPSE
jgi:Single-strand binding protein family